MKGNCKENNGGNNAAMYRRKKKKGKRTGKEDSPGGWLQSKYGKIGSWPAIPR